MRIGSCAAAVLAACALHVPVHAQSLTVLHTFENYQERLALAVAGNGDLYGIATGVLFRLSPSGTYTLLDARACFGATGYFMPGPGGDLYAYACGSFFRVAAGPARILDDERRRVSPDGSLVLTAGTSVIRIAADGTLSEFPVPIDFEAADLRGIALGPDGTLYGITWLGGSYCVPRTIGFACGSVFKVSPGGVYTVLHEFQEFDGQRPLSIEMARDGTLYGTALEGGNNVCFGVVGCGTLFSISQDGAFTLLHHFTSEERQARLSVGHADGNVYGVFPGEQGSSGAVFRTGPTARFEIVHQFGRDLGTLPHLLSPGPDGHMIGATLKGGDQDHPTLFSVHPTLVFNFLYQLDEGLAVDVFGWDSRTGYPARFWGTMSFVDKTDESNWVTRTSIFTMTSGALPPTCGSFSIDASSAAVGYAASSQVVTISGMPDGCTSGDWQASSNAPWLRVSAQSGSGPGAVTVSWTQNWTSTSRSAVVTIAGNPFIVAQDPFPAPPVSDPNSDFDNDGWTDLVFRHRTTGEMVAWLMAGPTMVNFKMLDPVSASTNWRLAGTGDLDGDRKPDLLWQEERSGLLYVWFMDGTTRKSHSYLSILGPADAGWKVVSVADMNGDGKPDLVWQHAVFGALAAWYLDGLTVTGRVSLDPWTVRDTRWHVVATGDFDRDGKTDLLWKHATEGYLVVWLMNGVTLRSVEWLAPGQLADVGWEIVATGDFNADGRLDIIFQHSSSGYMVAWFMDGLVQSGWLMLTPDRVQDPGWGIAAHR